MLPEIKAQWVAALRSGDYQQGKRTLTRKSAADGVERDCCLGVLCKLAVKAGINIKVQAGGPDYSPGVTAYDYETATLPSSVLEWAGLTSHNPTVEYKIEGHNGDRFALAELNDGHEHDGGDFGGLTFAEIADLIDAQL